MSQDKCNNTNNTHNTQYFKVTVIPEQAENILAKKEFDLSFQILSPILRSCNRQFIHSVLVSKQKFINKNIICNEPNLPITIPIYKNGFLLYAWSNMTVKARRTWTLLDLQQNYISNLVWTGRMDPCGSLLINKSFWLSCTGKKDWRIILSSEPLYRYFRRNRSRGDRFWWKQDDLKFQVYFHFGHW